MAYPKEKIEKKSLTLQITKENFVQILKGEQKVEHRVIFPNTMKRYLYWEGDINNPTHGIDIVEYKELYLINGRKPDSPRLRVEVTLNELIFLTDENNEQITYFEKGEEWDAMEMWFHLGKILETENCENIV